MAATWARALGATFFWDDHALVLRNPQVTAPDLRALFLQDLFAGSGLGASPFYRPLTVLSLAVDHALAGEAPWLYHLQSVAWHLLAVALLVTLARPRIGGPRAVAAGAIFGLHPILSEAVVWISARNDVMAGALVLGALLAFDRGRVLAGALLGAAAALTKEAAVVLPLLLVLWRLAWGERATRAELGAALAASGLALGLRQVATLGPLEIPPVDPTLLPVLPGRVAATVLGWLVWPWPLTGTASFYLAPPSLAAWAVALVALAGLLAAARARPGGLALLLFGACAWAPSVLAMLSAHTVGERYLYLPLAGIAVLVAGAAPARLWVPGVGAALLAVCVIQVRLGEWSSEATLWRSAVVRAPDGYSRYRLARWTQDHNEPGAFKLYADAITSDPPFRFACAPALDLALQGALSRMAAGDPAGLDPVARLAADLAAQGCDDPMFLSVAREVETAAKEPFRSRP